MSTPFLVALLVPALATALLLVLLKRSVLARLLADVPNARSLHSEPRPRIGGLAVLCGALPVAAWAAGQAIAPALFAAVLLAIVSAVDDWRSLPAALRLAAHALAASAVLLLMAPGQGPATLLAGAFALIWMTNLYNFMDGADGLAGGMAVAGFGAYAAAAALAGNAGFAVACLALASAAAGFLAFNFPPARVFLGDAGSVPLGLLAASLGLHGFITGAWPAWFPVLVFSPFIVDASLTLVRRLLGREKIWIAHRSHYYQRLLLAGCPPARLAALQYALMAACATSAVAFAGTGLMLQCGILAAWSMAYLILIVALDRWLEKMELAKK